MSLVVFFGSLPLVYGAGYTAGLRSELTTRDLVALSIFCTYKNHDKDAAKTSYELANVFLNEMLTQRVK